MKIIERFHSKLIFDRRVRVLNGHLRTLIPTGTHVLDVGCGNGLLAHLIVKNHSGVEIEGVDVLVRDKTYITVEPFDGSHIPHSDGSFDFVMFVDVLHHTEDPMVLLREARRVARTAIVIKDHLREGLFAARTLRLMDWVGNAHYGVALPYNYWSRRQWSTAFEALNLKPIVWQEDLGLYAWPASSVFERSLHFITRLDLT